MSRAISDRVLVQPIAADCWRICDTGVAASDPDHVLGCASATTHGWDVIWLRGDARQTFFPTLGEVIDAAEAVLARARFAGPHATRTLGDAAA